MTRDRRDISPPADSPGTGSWVSDLRDLERRDTPGDDATRLRELAARRTAEHPSSTPDRDEHEAADASSTTDSSASPLVTQIRRTATVDDMTLVGSPVDRRYGRSVEARVAVDRNRYDLELRLFRRPETDGFADAVTEQFDRWVDASAIDGVVPTLDAGAEPRPWSLTAPIEATVAERPPDTPTEALGVVADLAETVTTLHRHGAIHAGIDPRHVVYPAGSQRAQLDNVGLLDVYRRYTDPATMLDPRYAPPEYFDDRYGVVDRTTDVYSLGAVFYRLLTGEPPYDGSPADVREAVLTEPFPRPSATVDVPEVVDRVVRHATATDKFDRYESASALLADLRRLQGRR